MINFVLGLFSIFHSESHQYVVICKGGMRRLQASSYGGETLRGEISLRKNFWGSCSFWKVAGFVSAAFYPT